MTLGWSAGHDKMQAHAVYGWALVTDYQQAQLVDSGAEPWREEGGASVNSKAAMLYQTMRAVPACNMQHIKARSVVVLTCSPALTQSFGQWFAQSTCSTPTQDGDAATGLLMPTIGPTIAHAADLPQPC